MRLPTSRGPVLPGAGEEPDGHHRRSRAFPTTPGPRSITRARSAIPRPASWICDAEVAEVAAFTAFASTQHPVTARLIVRRVRDQARLEELFPVWRHHPFLTDSLEPAPVADVIHRRHAIIETTFADLIDGPLAHLPSGRFRANAPGRCARRSPTTCSAPPAPWPARPRPWPAARPCAARIVNVPARLAQPATPHRAAPARALALGEALAHLVGPRPRRRTATTHPGLNPSTPAQRPDPETHRGNAGQTSGSRHAHPTTP